MWVLLRICLSCLYLRSEPWEPQLDLLSSTSQQLICSWVAVLGEGVLWIKMKIIEKQVSFHGQDLAK